MKYSQVKTLVLGVISITLIACNQRGQVEHYQETKQVFAQPQTASPTTASTPTAIHQHNYTWTTPATWQAQKASSMRLASYLVPQGDEQGDISIVRLNGSAGGVLPNLNRWRAQIGLDPVQAPAPETLKAPAGNFLYWKLVNKDDPDLAMLVSMLVGHGHVLFIKLKGTAQVIQATEKDFHAFVSSMTASQGTTPTATPIAMHTAATSQPAMTKPETSQPATSQPATSQPATSQPAARQTLPPALKNKLYIWATPSNWIPQSTSSMRLASYAVLLGQEKGDVSLIQLGGGAGGVLPNLNRWRGQIGLSPVTNAKPTTLVSPVGNFLYWKLVNHQKPNQAMLVSMLVNNGHVLFIKLKGSSKLIQATEKDYQAFVTSIAPAGAK